jgi:methylmalonyl-CoA/ethylmalonyl-CoA epimerase
VFALHHIGLLVRDIHATRDLYARTYGYQVESEVIEDPAQTALVCFLRQSGGASWLELISPNGPESKLSRALQERPGLHHLCYEVADLDSACAALRERAALGVANPTPAVAFGGRRIAWFYDRAGQLVELVEAGPGPLSLAGIAGEHGE